MNSLTLCLTDADTILSQAMAKEFRISLAMHNLNGTCMQASTARYDSSSAEKIAGQNTTFHQKNAIVHTARLRFCCKKPDVSPVAIGRQIRFTGTTITARKSVPGTRLLASHLTCTNTTIPYSSSLPLIWNGITGSEADLVCLRHPCDDDEELCNTEEIEWD